MQRLFLLAVALVLCTAPAFAQDASRSVLTAIKQSDAPAAPAERSLVNIIQDPSFEAGRPPTQTVWIGTNPAYISGSPILSPNESPGANFARTGQYFLILGSSAAAINTGVTQQVTAAAGTYTLQFYLQAGVNAGSDSQFFVQFNGVELFRATPATAATYSAYTLVSVPVTVATSGTYTLSFLQTKTATPLINWFVDDVSMEAPVSGPGLAANPTTLAFGTATPVGTPSAPRTVTLTNNGTATTTVTAITSSNPAFTVQAPALPLTVAAGATATFTVTFTPTNATAQTGTISVASDAAGSPLTIAVTGTGNADQTTTIPAGNTTGAPTWARPTALGTGVSGTSCSPATTTTGNATPYVTRTFTVATAGSYTITTNYSLTADYDGWIDLYRGTFSATDQCLNHIAFDDDFVAATGQSGLLNSQIAAVALTPGTYVLVVTGYNNLDFGQFTGTVVGPPGVQFPGTAGEGAAANGRASLTASPNPTRVASRVRFTSATAQDVTVAVYDVTGRQVATLFQGAVAADQTVEASLEAASLPSGVYVVRATGADLNLTQRVTVVR